MLSGLWRSGNAGHRVIVNRPWRNFRKSMSPRRRGGALFSVFSQTLRWRRFGATYDGLDGCRARLRYFGNYSIQCFTLFFCWKFCGCMICRTKARLRKRSIVSSPTASHRIRLARKVRRRVPGLPGAASGKPDGPRYRHLDSTLFGSDIELSLCMPRRDVRVLCNDRQRYAALDMPDTRLESCAKWPVKNRSALQSSRH